MKIQDIAAQCGLDPTLFIRVRTKLTSIDKKKQLIQMAKNGESRPIRGRHQLGNVLDVYTHPKCGHGASYDENFTEKLKKLRPDWFSRKIGKAKIGNVTFELKTLLDEYAACSVRMANIEVLITSMTRKNVRK